MYHPNQNGAVHHYEYPYDPRTHTFASPAGMHYPAPTTHPLPLRPGTNGHFYHQEAITYAGHGQGREGPRGRHEYSHHGRYGPGDWEADPRAGLGLLTAGHFELVPPHLPHTSFHLGRPDLPPIPNRSITLDSRSTTARRIATPPFFGSSNHSQSHGETRTTSPLSSRSSQIRHDQAYAPNGKSWPKVKVGGPPKVPLGGIGGKPWDERMKDDRSVSSPLPNASIATPLRPVQNVAEAEGPTFKGNPIIFKPPPSTYLPEDSPDLPATRLDLEGGGEKPRRVPRKDAYPWPVQPPRGPPDTIPLPPSPIDQDPERSGRRTWTSIASTDIMEPAEGLLIKGKRKEVVVALPFEGKLEEQQPLDKEAIRKQQVWDAVYGRPTPTTPDDERSPVGRSHKSSKQEISELHHTLLKMNSTPSHGNTTDDPNRARSPPTPTRGGQSNTAQGNSAFVRRQLGGMLKSGPSSRMARGTPSSISIPESRASDKGDERGVRGSNQEDRNGGKDNSKDGTISQSPNLGVDNESTRVSSANMTANMPARIDGPDSGETTTPASGCLASHISSKAGRIGSTELEVRRDSPKDKSLSDGKFEDQSVDQKAEDPLSISRSVITTRKQSDAAITPSAKRLRPTAQPYHPQSSQSSESSLNPIHTAPKARLRPTASAFTPRTHSIATPIDIPAGAGAFTFNVGNISHRGMQSWSSLESDGQNHIFVRGSEKPNHEQTASRPFAVHEDAPDFHGQQRPLTVRSELRAEGEDNDRDRASPEPLQDELDGQSPGAASRTVSEPSHPSQSLEFDEGSDLPTARPCSTSGREERFSTRQQPGATHRSPAAEIHGIFASPDRHSSPLSEISDSIEVLSESFDPVSYSYETDTESTYEVSSTAVFYTSTPRGGHQVLPLDSSHSETDSGRSSPEEYHTVPTVNVDQDPRRRFMEWTFPSPGHGRMPSIYRRHTFDHLNPQEEDASHLPENGVASTFASRVGDLRAHLAQNPGKDHLRVTSDTGGVVSTRSSAEFPMRSPTKKLAVVNDSGETGAGAKNDLSGPRQPDEGKKDNIDISMAGLATQVRDVVKALQARPAPSMDLSPLTQMLEQQSTLISSLASAVQYNKGHQNDHLTPLLENQQAVLNKLSTVEGSQSEITDLLDRFDEQQARLVRNLRSELADAMAEKEEQATQLHRLKLELLDSRHAQEAFQMAEGETRDNLDMAQSRNAALELHLQSLVKEKQSAAREYEEDQANRQSQQALFEKISADLQVKQEELLVERRRNDIMAETIRSQSFELIELRQSTSQFQETLIDRLSRIEEGVQGSGVDSEEHIRLQDRNQRLQKDVDELKAQHLLSEQEKHAEQIRTMTALQEVEQLRQEVTTERDLRRKAEARAEAAEEALQKESVSRFQAQMIAKERSHFANMQEVQLGARTRECNYWQTFALTHDRNAYRNYLKSKPFHGISSVDTGSSSTPTNKGKFTPDAIPTYDQLRTAKGGSLEEERWTGDAKGDDHQTPTKAGKEKGKGREVESRMDEDKHAWSSRT